MHPEAHKTHHHMESGVRVAGFVIYSSSFECMDKDPGTTTIDYPRARILLRRTRPLGV